MTVKPTDPSIVGGGGGVEEAPEDGIQRARNNAAWEPTASGAIIAANLTLDGTEDSSTFTLVATTTRTITLPLASTVAAGYLLNLTNRSDKKSTKWTVGTQGSDTINGGSSFSITTGESMLVERITSSAYIITNASIDIPSVAEVTTAADDVDILIYDPVSGVAEAITKEDFLADHLEIVSTDATLTGDGTTGDPLGLAISVQGGIRVIGFWDASTNTPDLSALTEDQGEAYQVSVAGSTSLNGETNWGLKDLVVWSDDLAGNWFKLDNTDDVLSVAGKTGVVTLVKGDVGLGNVDNTSDADKPISTANQTALDANNSISFDANDAIYPSSNPAVAISRNGHPIISFDDTVAENVLFNKALPANYNDGDINVDIDWVAESATTGGVTWGVEFERNAPGGDDIDADSFDTQQTGTDTTSGTSGIITRTTITLTQAEADDIEALDSYRLRLQRVVGDSGDDMTGDAQVLRVGVR